MLRATHTTTYLYSEPVSICHTEVHLAPRSGRSQRVIDHRLSVRPAPDTRSVRKDYFGNDTAYFSIQAPHQTLTITAESLIDVKRTAPWEPGETPAWEEVRAAVQRHADAPALEAFQFVFESPRVTLGADFAEYASPSFPEKRPFIEAALDLSHRIHTEFHYDRRATTVSTPVAEVLESRRGVCQDFAHFTIACMRSLGLPARYVSGYLRDGDMVGSEASHAWVSVFCPGHGWFDLDPTNDVAAADRHLTLAWGRDYSDVAPVKGVALGGGEQVINVSVELRPAD